MTTESHKNNVYALNEKGEEKHISEVERGRKGYYCMGCNAEVEARKGDIKSHYYAHVPTNVTIERKCTFSDETYRHKLAKEILQRIKQIKVPTLYKYPPHGLEGKPNKIKDSWTIKAQVVKIERQFYEDESGEIKYGQNINFEREKTKYLLIQPDVSFFDEAGNPILLIEVVATHNIDQEKLSKIKRLGIDTVQVTIPKDSPKEIEMCFYRTNRTQWIYNYEQETTVYIPTSKGNKEGISPISKFQRKLFKAEESYECRSSQLKNLIRGIRKCLGSEQFRKVKKSIGEELRRVEENTERNRIRLQGIQTKHEREIKELFRMEEATLRIEEEEFNREERKFQQYIDDLEGRYYRKREDIERIQKSYKPEIQSEIDRIEKYLEELGGNGTSFEEQIEELTREEEKFEREINFEEKQLERVSRTEQDAIAESERRREDLPAKYRELETNLRREITDRRERNRSQFKNTEEKIRREFENFRRETIKAVEGKISDGELRIHRRIKDTLDKGNLLLSIREGKSSIRTLNKIKEILDSGTYKNWI